MKRSDATGVAGIVIGGGLAVAASAVPWEIPEAVRHILFWIGMGSALLGALWL